MFFIETIQVNAIVEEAYEKEDVTKFIGDFYTLIN